MLNYIWLGLILIGVLVASLLGRLGGDDGIVETAFSMAETSVMGIALPLAGLMMLWLGMMRLAEKAGLMKVVAKVLAPVMKRLFPEVPSEHPAMGSIIMNMSANMLGLGNAATPLGLRAMQQLDEINPHKGTASNAMCTFLAINTSSVTLIPATAIALLAASGITEPYRIIGSAILATLCSTAVAIVAVKLFQRLPIFAIRESDLPSAQEVDTGDGEEEEKEFTPAPWSRGRKIWLSVVGVLTALIVLLQFNPGGMREMVAESTGVAQLVEQEEARKAASAAAAEARPVESEEKAEESTEPAFVTFMVNFSTVAIPLIFFLFVGYAMIRGVPVFEEFVAGAKEGFGVALRIMPYLVAMLVAMGVFRDSGALLILQWMLSPLLNLLQFPVDLLPLAIMRPLSGGGSIGMLGEILASEDLPLLIKYTAGTMFGSTETTFYVLAVYFGSVGIRRTRHALAAGLCADAAGVLAAIFICRMLFAGV